MALWVQLLLVELIYFSSGLLVWALASKRPGCFLVCLDLPDQGLRKMPIFQALHALDLVCMVKRSIS